jgi:hypothetical protein
MPLIETVSLLTTLASAYQVLRSKPPGDSSAAVTEVAETSGVVVAYDLARSTYDTTLQRLDAANRYLNGLVAAAGIAILLAVLTMRASTDQDLGASGQAIAALVAFVVIAACGALVRLATGARLTDAGEMFTQQPIKQPIELMEVFVRSAAACSARNEKSLRTITLVSELLLLALGVEIVLLVLWVLSI